MVKLVPAKCPSCGANLELDDNLKRTECEFCKTTIIVDEAIQKYQIELKGRLKVSNDYSGKIETAKKYIKLKEYGNAKRVIENILEEDELNLEALKIKVELNIKAESIIGSIYTDNFDFKKEREILELDSSVVEYIENLISDINKIVLLDENKDFFDFTTEHLKKLNEKKELINKYLNKKHELIDKCNNYIYNPTFKCSRLLKVFKTLKFNKRKVEKDFSILKVYDNEKMVWTSDGIKRYSPKISNIGYKTAMISCSARIDNYKQIRDNCIDLDEQIKLIDELIGMENKSLFSRLFDK